MQIEASSESDDINDLRRLMVLVAGLVGSSNYVDGFTGLCAINLRGFHSSQWRCSWLDIFRPTLSEARLDQYFMYNYFPCSLELLRVDYGAGCCC